MNTSVTFTLDELPLIAQEFARELRGGDVVLLYGELGAGKTTFTKAVAAALGVGANVTSPTFTLMNVYPVPAHETIRELIHVDTYRIERTEEFEDIGMDAFVGAPNTLTIIEWPEKFLKYHPSLAHARHLHLTQGATSGERILTTK